MTRYATLLLLLLGYAATLAVSAAHLAEWYALTLGGLPRFLATALAVTLELNAFLLSLLSNSVLRGSRWAAGGSLVALGLVWLGNFRSMQRAGGEVSPLEVFAMSLFVPVGTYVIGKVVGELLTPRAEKRPSEGERVEEDVEEGVLQVPPEPALFEALLRTLETPMPLREIYRALPEHRARLPEALQTLERRGLVRNEGGLWVRSETVRR